MYVWGSYQFQTDTINAAPGSAPPLKFPVRAPFRAASGEPQYVPSGFPSSVDALACGLKHCVVASGGALYGFGANHHHQLGQGVPSYVSNVRLIPFRGRTEPVDVACGKRHTLVRTRDGLLYSAGDNGCGQLGQSLKGVNDFAELPIGGVAQIAAAENSSFALTDKGAVYSWGFAGSGHLAHGDRGLNENAMSSKELKTTLNVPSPKHVRWFSDKRVKIVEISAGKEHMVARSDVEVYTVGEGFYGKLGSGDVSCLTLPYRVTFPARQTAEKLVSIAAGVNHTVVLKHSGEVGSVVYFFGKLRGDDGSLVPIVVQTALNNLRTVFAGCQSSMGALSDDGRLYVWGDFTPLHSGAPARASRSEPELVECLEDFYLTHFNCAGQTFVAIADDARNRRAPPPPSGTDASATGEVSVAEAEGTGQTSAAAEYHTRFDTTIPHEDRITAHKSSVDKQDEAAAAFYELWLGAAEGAAYVDQMPVPDVVIVERPQYKKRGAHGLSVGDKVRLWMTDVYALAIVGTPPASATTGQLSQPAATQPLHDSAGDACVIGEGQSLYLEWMRDDWVPETVELFSDDETLDEDNPNRWQSVWFLEAPTSKRGV